MDAVSSAADLPQDAHHVYHVTDRRNKASILSSGIDSTKASKDWQRVNKFLHAVAENEGITNRPANRAECVFAYPRFADIYDEEKNWVVAIDLRQVSAPMWRASYHTVTEVNDILRNKRSNKPEDIIEMRSLDANAKTAYQKAVDYWDSLNSAAPPIQRGGELLIEGHVPAAAITHYVE